MYRTPLIHLFHLCNAGVTSVLQLSGSPPSSMLLKCVGYSDHKLTSSKGALLHTKIVDINTTFNIHFKQCLWS